MKYTELKVEQLKKELSKVGLSTSDTKTELLKRLMEQFQHRGMGIESHNFECKDQVEASKLNLREPSMNQQVSQESVVGARMMRLDFSKDMSSSQRNDPILSKRIWGLLVQNMGALITHTSKIFLFRNLDDKFEFVEILA